MRSTQLLFALTTLTVSSLAAQQPAAPGRFAFAVGPAWNYQLSGVHVRAEYHLIRDRWFGLQLDAGGWWTPSQSLSFGSALYGYGSRFEGTGQAADFHLGLSATLAPWRRAPIAPYLLAGAAAVQSWGTRQGAYRDSGGAYVQFVPKASFTRGEIVPVAGVGLRLRVASHPIHFELRRYGGRTNVDVVTVGTTLSF
jgi:hypothetical protein